MIAALLTNSKPALQSTSSSELFRGSTNICTRAKYHRSPSPLPWKWPSRLVWCDCKYINKWMLLSIFPLQVLQCPSCHVRTGTSPGNHVPGTSPGSGCGPWLKRIIQNSPSSWQVLTVQERGRFVVFWDLRSTLLALCISHRCGERCQRCHSYHALGRLCVKSRSARFSLASLPSTANVYESIPLRRHMQILICEHNYLLCMHKTDSLAHSAGIA